MSKTKTETSCKNCIFAIYDNITQTGCLHGRIEKFKDNLFEAYDNEKEFYVIKRFCNLYRTKSWNDGVPDLEKSHIESAISFDLFIDINDIAKYEIKNLISDINSISYIPKKYKIILFHNHKVDKESKNIILKLFSNITVEHPILSVYADKNEYLDSIIEKSNSTFHTVIEPSALKDLSNAMYLLNKSVNEDLVTILLAEYKNHFFISNLSCKLVYHKFYQDYNKKMKEIMNDAKKNEMFIKYEN